MSEPGHQIMSKAFITGVAGTTLSNAERTFIAAERPWGFILFKRNVETTQQVAQLVADLRACVGNSDAPVLIDQEGGRVQRLGPPHWPVYPAGAGFGTPFCPNPAGGPRGAGRGCPLLAAAPGA